MKRLLTVNWLVPIVLGWETFPCGSADTQPGEHTSATLLLTAGEPVHVVSERLGHRDATVTVYAHVLKTHQQGAADRIGALLHGIG